VSSGEKFVVRFMLLNDHCFSFSHGFSVDLMSALQAMQLRMISLLFTPKGGISGATSFAKPFKCGIEVRCAKHGDFFSGSNALMGSKMVFNLRRLVSA